LEKLRGMFSFAIWDSKVQTLLLARDRIGIKPLYYHLSNKSLVFASEIKAILADPSIDRQIDPALIDRFLTFLYLPGEDTLLKGIQKLAPGHYLLAKDGQVAIRQYWDLQFEDPSEKRDIKKTEADLLRLLAETVDLHMIADVPVGVLLSGGIDSTGVLSLAVQSTDKRISTFTVGFSEKDVADERPYAKLAAERFGTHHYEMTITPNDFVSFLPKYVWHMEEPVCEPPAIALYYVSKLAKKYVTVLLSGEGGDEAFAGYSNYRNVVWLERLKRCGPLLNSMFAGGMSVANSVFDISGAAKYVALMKDRFPDYYWSRTSHPYRNVGGTLSGIYSEGYLRTVHRECSVKPVRDLETAVHGKGNLNAMLYIDSKTWLPDDLLIKADKMTMANSVELRVPLLDHRVLEFAASLPANYKLSGVNTKYILKRALSKNIPSEILNRKKTGFPVPYGSWLRNDLKDVAWDVLMDSKAINRGYFRKDAVDKLLQANANGTDYSKEIFSLLTLEIWQRTFLEKEQVVL
jgi:asparagine synthase (glutamine-hydrolysing)